MTWNLFVFICVCIWKVHGGSVTKYISPECVETQHCQKIYGGLFQLGSKDIELGIEDGTFTLNCDSWKALDYPTLPRFASAAKVSKIELQKCSPPTNKTYAAVLGEINVTLQTEGSLIITLREQPALSAHHFEGLEHVSELKVGMNRYGDERHVPIPGFLAPLHKLHSLSVEKFEFPESEQLPASLQSLYLSDTKLKVLPKSLRTLPGLKQLYVVSRGLDAFKTEQRIDTNETVVNFMSSLENVTLIGWTEEYPGKIVHCDALLAFHFSSMGIKALPERWLAACPRLESLHMDVLKMATLPAKLLEGASTIVDLAITSSELQFLPEGLLDYVPNLRLIDLAGNNLRTLPSGFFKESRALLKIDLFYNNFGAELMDELKTVYSLTELVLYRNTDMPDLCEPQGPSKLINLKNLKTMDLSYTSLTHTCSDWRNVTIEVDMWNKKLKDSITSQQGLIKT